MLVAPMPVVSSQSCVSTDSDSYLKKATKARKPLPLRLDPNETTERWLVTAYILYAREAFAILYSNIHYQKGTMPLVLIITLLGLASHSCALILWATEREESLITIIELVAALFFITLLAAVVVIQIFKSRPMQGTIWWCFVLATTAHSLSSVAVIAESRNDRTAHFVAFVVCLAMGCSYFTIGAIFLALYLAVGVALAVFELYFRLLMCKLCCCEVAKRFDEEYQPYLFEQTRCPATQCVICLGRFEEGAVVCVMRCHSTHVFHEGCILEWARTSSRCPICKSDAGFL